MNMVTGPLTGEKASAIYHCAQEELCFGPLAAIDKGNKVRAIYNGAFGGAKKYIQNQISKRIITPTVLAKLCAGYRRRRRNWYRQQIPLALVGGAGFLPWAKQAVVNVNGS